MRLGAKRFHNRNVAGTRLRRARRRRRMNALNQVVPRCPRKGEATPMYRTSKSLRKVCIFSFISLALTGLMLQPWGVRFNFERPVIAQTTTPPIPEGTVFAVTASNNLISFKQFSPNAIIKTTAITGLQPSENILGIDFRPRTGVLYGFSSQSRLYTIDTTTAAATQVGTAPFTPAINGTSFGFD